MAGRRRPSSDTVVMGALEVLMATADKYLSSAALLGDAWSIISSERSDDKHVERVVLRALSKAQGRVIVTSVASGKRPQEG